MPQFERRGRDDDEEQQQQHSQKVLVLVRYVMDCRRPFHLANVHAGRHVVVFWDGVGAGVPDDNDDNIGPMTGILSDGDDFVRSR